MIRFLLGTVLGAAGALYVLAVLLTASRETTTTGTNPYVIDWGKVFDSPTWTGPIT